LEHHGIPGQKWGVKNGPPYPLDRETNKLVRMSRRNEPKRSHFTQEDQRNYLAAHPVESMYEMDQLPKGIRRKTARYAINHSDDNPRGVGRHYNCQNCAVAFDMVERGYDVIARPRSDGSNVGDIASFYKGGQLKVIGVDHYGKDYYDAFNNWGGNYNTFKEKRAFNKFNDLHNKYANQAEGDVIREITSQGSGSRGILVVGWHNNYDPKKRTTFFHAINYKNERGKVMFYDAQDDFEFNGHDRTFWISSDVDPREIFIMRTDNLEPSDYVGEAVISRRRSR